MEGGGGGEGEGIRRASVSSGTSLSEKKGIPHGVGEGREEGKKERGSENASNGPLPVSFPLSYFLFRTFPPRVETKGERKKGRRGKNEEGLSLIDRALFHAFRPLDPRQSGDARLSRSKGKGEVKERGAKGASSRSSLVYFLTPKTYRSTVHLTFQNRKIRKKIEEGKRGKKGGRERGVSPTQGFGLPSPAFNQIYRRRIGAPIARGGSGKGTTKGKKEEERREKRGEE